MTVYTIEGQPIHAVQQGQTTRQVALLIHGWSSSWYAMSPLLPLLSQRFNCIAVDLPGYGESPPMPQRTTIPAYVDLLAKLIEEVSDGPVVLIGHSMGGMISMSLALRYPVLVERMVLLCPTISGRLSTTIDLAYSPVRMLERIGRKLAVALMGTAVIDNVVLSITDRLMRPVSFAERTGITEADYMRVRGDARRPGQGRVRAECYFAMRENNLMGRLGGIEPPSLVLWGAEDNTVPLRDAGVVADEWHGADLRIIPKAGHWPHFETPDNTRRMIAAFLGLPLISSELNKALDDRDLATINDIAQVLSHSDVGHELNQAQRVRLAAQFHQHVYKPGETIVRVQDAGTDMFIVQDGTVEVWSDPDSPGQAPRNLRYITALTPGQITGELAMLDGGLRSADLRAGPEGATVLSLERDRLLALSEDDSTLGTRVLWNIARAMALRQRFILWQLQKALQKKPTGPLPKVPQPEYQSEPEYVKP
jgi:pimeloyl-ACP methyl ester carboxylesterase/CRP-like cAMP-binding protein